MRESIAAVIPAAGTGSRLGSKIPKPLVRIGSSPLFIRTVKRLMKAYPFSRVVLAVEPRSMSAMRGWIQRTRIRGVEVVAGGETRAESVRNGVDRLDGERYVLIHDVARPFVGAEEVRELIRRVKKDGACILALKATATVKEIDLRDRRICRTLDRNRIYLAQTPQAFRMDVLKAAYARHGRRYARFTDEAGMVESAGGKVTVVEGSSLNIKITTPGDLAVARAIIRREGKFR